MAREGIEHVALGFAGEKQLLIVLAVDIRQIRAEIAEQRGGHGAAAQEGAGLAACQNFALHQQLAVFDFDAGGLQQAADGAVLHLEGACHAGARSAGAHHVSGSARAEEQAEGVDDDGFAAAGLTGKEVEAVVELDAEALDDGQIFDHEFEEHCANYSGSPSRQITAGMPRRRENPEGGAGGFAGQPRPGARTNVRPRP